MSVKSTLWVHASENKKYPIYIENDLGHWQRLKINKGILGDGSKKKVFLIVDSLLPQRLVDSFILQNLDIFPEARKDKKIIYIKSGEKNKNFSNLESYYKQLLKNGIQRDSYILNLGGGVIGDLGGFLAATILRGVSFIQIPTTLLSIVDSSVGGKVGVNVGLGKNMVGAFYQPKMVYVNLSFLESLNDREWVCGLAEIWKHSLLSMNTKLMKHLQSVIVLAEKKSTTPILLLKKNPELLKNIFLEAIKIKVRVVEKDEREEGLRAILNLGHTTAHALEDMGSYKKFKHGEAVSRGLVTALFLSHMRYKFDKKVLEKMFDMMTKLQLPCDTAGFVAKKVFQQMRFDKKGLSGTQINFVLLKDIGQALWKQKVSFDEFQLAWLEQKKRFG